MVNQENLGSTFNGMNNLSIKWNGAFGEAMETAWAHLRGKCVGVQIFNFEMSGGPFTPNIMFAVPSFR